MFFCVIFDKAAELLIHIRKLLADAPVQGYLHGKVRQERTADKDILRARDEVGQDGNAHAVSNELFDGL